MISKIKIVCQKLNIVVHFWTIFRDQKSRFIDFFEVVLELGRKCYSPKESSLRTPRVGPFVLKINFHSSYYISKIDWYEVERFSTAFIVRKQEAGRVNLIFLGV